MSDPAPALAGRYAALERRLAERHAHDRERYAAGKSDFVAQAVIERPRAHTPRRR